MTRKTIPISQLKPSPRRHEELPPFLTAKINQLCRALAEVYPQSIDVWMDGFQRDLNPESEVKWWDRLTRCYLAYTEPKELSLEQKRTAFKILFTLGMGNGIQGVKAEFKHLPDDAEKEILGLVGLSPQ